MMTNINKITSNVGISDKLVILLVALFPLTMITGNLLINLTFISLFIIFILDTTFNKNFIFLKDITFWIIFYFFCTLLFNIYFSLDPMNSLSRVLKILLMISFAMQIKKVIQKYPLVFKKIILNSWLVIFSIVLIDVVFEIIFGFNTLGYKSNYPTRISSFFGDEHVVGGYFLAFCIFYISQISLLLNKYKKSLIGLILVLIFISLLIGERSNSIKFIISMSIFFVLVIKPNLKSALLILVIFLLSFFSFINLNETLKYRYKTFFSKTITQESSFKVFLKNSQHIAHYDASIKIFQEYPVFGVGLKNFRNEVGKIKYRNKNVYTIMRKSTHPHQLHFELLSETGLFGYISFFIFIGVSLYLSIKNYFINRDIIQLSAIIYIITSIIPILPSGSFFSTFTSGLFWINYSIMMGYNKNDFFVKS